MVSASAPRMRETSMGTGNDDLVVGCVAARERGAIGRKRCTCTPAKNGIADTRVDGESARETFGFDATGMGDVDGDGSIDFLLTSAWSAVNRVEVGEDVHHFREVVPSRCGHGPRARGVTQCSKCEHQPAKDPPLF